ncbi:MAG TPA: hypothetical protein VFQ06_00505 [Nitrospira sp.]|nr:hypothetical protein [Nitrospira sp.]
MTFKRFMLNVLALALFGAIAATVVTVALTTAQRHNLSEGTVTLAGSVQAGPAKPPAPKPAHTWVDTRSYLSRVLEIRDCPTEDVMDMICVWDSKTGQDFVAVFGEIFKVGFNDDGTVWVDYNHDGEDGYPDA